MAKTTMVNAGTQNMKYWFMALNDKDNNVLVNENIQSNDEKNNDAIDVNNHAINDSNVHEKLR